MWSMLDVRADAVQGRTSIELRFTAEPLRASLLLEALALLFAPDERDDGFDVFV